MTTSKEKSSSVKTNTIDAEVINLIKTGAGAANESQSNFMQVKNINK